MAPALRPFLGSRAKYCHNGAMAFAHHHSVGLPGVHGGDHGPFPRLPETAVLQGKAEASRGPSPLGSEMGATAFGRLEKYSHDGAMTFPPALRLDLGRRQLLGDP
jgi:hypothetical protein